MTEREHQEPQFINLTESHEGPSLSPPRFVERLRGFVEKSRRIDKEVQNLLACASLGGLFGFAYSQTTPPSPYFPPELYGPACIAGGAVLGVFLWKIGQDVSKN